MRINLTQLHSQSSASWRVLQFPWYRQRQLSLSAVPGTTPAAHAAVRHIRMREYVDPI